jgi:hypothetical protein
MPRLWPSDHCLHNPFDAFSWGQFSSFPISILFSSSVVCSQPGFRLAQGKWRHRPPKTITQNDAEICPRHWALGSEQIPIVRTGIRHDRTRAYSLAAMHILMDNHQDRSMGCVAACAWRLYSRTNQPECAAAAGWAEWLVRGGRTNRPGRLNLKGDRGVDPWR